MSPNVLPTKKIKTGGWALINKTEKTASKVDKSYVKYLQTGGTHMKPPNNKGAM